jgi:hypothetical protein
MPPQRRSRVHKNNKAIKKAHRTRRRTKDILFIVWLYLLVIAGEQNNLNLNELHLDQIHDDLRPENVEKLKTQPLDVDLPGLGQFYCIECR